MKKSELKQLIEEQIALMRNKNLIKEAKWSSSSYISEQFAQAERDHDWEKFYMSIIIFGSENKSKKMGINEEQLEKIKKILIM